METNYYKAWKEFKKTSDFKKAIKVMEEYSITKPYNENLLNIAFSAGWNATNIETKIIESKTTQS